MGAGADPHPSTAGPARNGAPSADDRAALRFAMLSVYQGSLGRQLQSRGAASVLLPPEVRPLSLGTALNVIAERFPQALRDAVWRVVRSVPAPHRQRHGRRYPPELQAVLDRPDVIARCADGAPRRLDQLDEERRSYRSAANLLGAALVAEAEGRTPQLRALRGLLEDDPGRLLHDAEQLLGMSAAELLATLDDREGIARMTKLESEVGLDLYDFVADFADAVAFLRWWNEEERGMTVYPASTVISQDSQTLVTTVTATALVGCDDFGTLARSVDPQCWMCASSVVTTTRFVRGACDLAAAPPSPPGTPFEERFLEEAVSVTGDAEQHRLGAFHNVLRVGPFRVREHPSPAIDLDFSLARSIDSRILWDSRPGGILVDQGFIKVRPVGRDRWRVTSRKVLKFSDRSPNADGRGWVDFGQMLNYLAPAALSWWLESELYSAADAIYSDPQKVQDCLDRHRMGADDERRAAHAAA